MAPIAPPPVTPPAVDEQDPALRAATTARAVAEHRAAEARLDFETARIKQETAKLNEPLGAEDNAKQKAAIADLNLKAAVADLERGRLLRPWWRSWNITALGAIVTITTPVIVGVSGHYEKEKELALNAQRQNHDIELAKQKQEETIRGVYLDRIVDPRQSRRTLRLLMATSPAQNLRQWALEELRYVDEEDVRETQERDELKASLRSDEEQLRTALKDNYKGQSELAKHLESEVVAKQKALDTKIGEEKHFLPP